MPEAAKPKEEPKPSDPGPEAPPEDRVVLDKSFSPKAHQSFDAIKTIAKGLRDQLTERDRELKEAKAQVENIKAGAVNVETPEVVKLRADNETMSKRLMVLDLQSHPRFQQEFVAPRSAAEQEASAILQAAGVTEDIPALLAKNQVDFRKGISEIAKKLPTPLDQADFANAMRTAHALKVKGDQAISNAREMNQTLQQQQAEGYKQAFDEVYSRTLGQLKVAELRAPNGAKPEEIAEVEAFNNGVRGIRSQAERIALGASNPKDIAVASLQAAAFRFQQTHAMPAIMKMIAAKDARIAELEGNLSGIRARNPNRDIRGIPPSEGGVDPSKMNNQDAAEYWFNKK